MSAQAHLRSLMTSGALVALQEGVIALVLIAVFGAGALLWPEPNTLLAASARDFARFLILALMTYAGIRALVSLGLARVKASLITAGAALSLGVAVELAEMAAGSRFAVRDVAMDLAAGLCGLVASLVRLPGIGVGRRMAWLGLFILLLLAAVSPFAQTLHAYVERNSAFPVLLDARRNEGLFWVRTMPAPVSIRPVDTRLQKELDELAFVVPLDEGGMPGLAIDEPYGDWRGYSTLALDLINPGDTALDLILNVDDMRGSGAPGDRYDERVLLAPRSRTILRTSLESIVRSIPHRRFALDDMDIVMIYRRGPANGEQLMVRRIWLE